MSWNLYCESGKDYCSVFELFGGEHFIYFIIERVKEALDKEFPFSCSGLGTVFTKISLYDKEKLCQAMRSMTSFSFTENRR